MSNFIEKYIFKKRYILTYELQSFSENERVSFFSLDNMEIESVLKYNDSNLARYLNMRAGDPSWYFFYYSEGDEILGYSFLHIPVKVEWNDSLPTLSGEARVSSNYVYPEHRGKKIRGLICEQQIDYSFKKGLKMWSVIERFNNSSIRAESKYCYRKENNYLLKVFSRNIISIISNPFQIHLLLGRKREKR